MTEENNKVDKPLNFCSRCGQLAIGKDYCPYCSLEQALKKKLKSLTTDETPKETTEEPINIVISSLKEDVKELEKESIENRHKRDWLDGRINDLEHRSDVSEKTIPFKKKERICPYERDQLRKQVKGHLNKIATYEVVKFFTNVIFIILIAFTLVSSYELFMIFIEGESFKALGIISYIVLVIISSVKLFIKADKEVAKEKEFVREKVRELSYNYDCDEFEIYRFKY